MLRVGVGVRERADIVGVTVGVRVPVELVEVAVLVCNPDADTVLVPVGVAVRLVPAITGRAGPYSCELDWISIASSLYR